MCLQRTFVLIYGLQMYTQAQEMQLTSQNEVSVWQILLTSFNIQISKSLWIFS